MRDSRCTRLVEKVFSRQLLIFCIILFTFGFNASPVQGWEWHPAGWAMWDPVEESERLAEELLEAGTVPEIEVLIYEVLKLMEVQIYDGVGNVVQEGDQYFADEFYLYDFQVRLLARAFFEENYMPLNNVIQLWAEVGLMMEDPLGYKTPVNPELIEGAIRSLREWAEENPQDPGGFIIRLIDCLGDREKHDFNLLEEVEEEDSSEGPMGITGIMKESAREEMEELLEYEEEELSEEEMELFLEGAMSGDIGSMLGAFLSEEKLKEVEEGLSEGISGIKDGLSDPEITSEERQFLSTTADLLESFEKTIGGGSIDELSELGYKQLKAQKDVLLSKEKELSKQYEVDVRNLSSSEPENALEMAEQLNEAVGILQNIENMVWGNNMAEVALKTFEEHQKLTEEEYSDREYLPDPPSRAGIEEEEPTSNLILDPLQSLLLQIDLLVITRRSVGGDLHDLFGLPLFSSQAYASGSSGSVLGTLGDGIKRVFDHAVSEILEGTLAGEIKKKIDLPGKVLNILHGLIMMTCHEIQMEVEYSPEPDAIEHISGVPERIIIGLRKRVLDEERFSKKISVKATAIFDPPDAAMRAEFGRMAAAKFSEFAATQSVLGPMSRLGHQQLASSLAELQLPQPGPQADLPIKFTFDREIQQHAELRSEEWDEFGQGIVNTNEEGVAEVNFYLKRDQGLAVIAGGESEWTKEEGFFIRAHPLTQIPDSLFLTPADYPDLAFSLADQLQGLTPGMGSSDTRVWIERLKPTPWEGTITVERNVSAELKTPRFPPGNPPEPMLSNNTQWESNFSNSSSNWKYTLEADVFLSPDGDMVEDPLQDYTVFDRRDVFTSLDINKKDNTTFDRWHKCENHQETILLEKKESFEVFPRDDPVGETKVLLEFPSEVYPGVYDLPPGSDWQYRVIVTPPRLPQTLYGVKTTEFEQCINGNVEQKTIKEDIVRGPWETIGYWLSLEKRRYPEIYDSRWFAYDVDDEVLEGEISWEKTPEETARQENIRQRLPALADLMYPDITVTTTVRWYLERVQGEDREIWED